MENKNQESTSRQKGKVKGYIRRLELTLNDCTSSGSDPILTLELLSRCTDEANTLG